MESKIKFTVSGRLEPKAVFKRLEVRSTFDALALAEERASEWVAGKRDLVKAKPETSIESVNLAHKLDCCQCALPLFEDDLYYFMRSKSYCTGCAENLDGGLYDIVGNVTVLDEKL